MTKTARLSPRLFGQVVAAGTRELAGADLRAPIATLLAAVTSPRS